MQVYGSLIWRDVHGGGADQRGGAVQAPPVLAADATQLSTSVLSVARPDVVARGPSHPKRYLELM